MVRVHTWVPPCNMHCTRREIDHQQHIRFDVFLLLRATGTRSGEIEFGAFGVEIIFAEVKMAPT